jgi:hypothetical protein
MYKFKSSDRHLLLWMLQKEISLIAGQPMKLKLICDRRSVCQSVSVSGSHLELMARFFFFFLSDNCGFVDVGNPLWREYWSIIYWYNCFWALPGQSLSGPSPAELTTIFYSFIWHSPYLDGQVLLFISPRNRVAQLYLPGTVPFSSPLTTRRATVKLF